MNKRIIINGNLSCTLFLSIISFFIVSMVIPSIIFSEQVDPETWIETVPLAAEDVIDVLKDGKRIKQHSSKKVIKEGVTELSTFTVYEDILPDDKLDPLVTIATKAPIRRSQLGDVVRVIEGDELETLANERKTEKFGERDIDLKYLKKLQEK